MKIKGFTLIELIIGLLIFSLILFASWNVFSSGSKNAYEVISNHTINDEIERVLMKITDEIREANLVSTKFPESINESEINDLKTESSNNRLEFDKINYDFTIDPSTLSNGEVNYTKDSVKYFLEKDDSENEGWTLYKESVTYDINKKPITGEMTIYPVLKGIKRCVFYRIKDPDVSRQGNVYMNIELSRQDSPYTNSITISVKERGTCPEY